MSAKLLAIDDDTSICSLLTAHYDRQGFSVVSAFDGREGLACYRREQPDLVLCDLRLPDIGGFEVLQELLLLDPDLPVIVVSVVDSLDDAVRAFRLGAVDYITKPLTNLAVLDHAIARALERARLVRNNRSYRENLEKTNQRLQQSLQQLKEDEEAARRLQFQLLPPNRQIIGGYHFQHRLWTSLFLSGDFVDYFEIDSERIGFYMADVSGHGVSSAFVTVLLKSYMSRYLELYWQGKSRGVLDPAKIFNRLNRNVLKSNTDKYLTMFYGVINKTENRLYYSNGGQFPYPLIYDGEKAQFIECKSKPIGLFGFAEYRSAVLELPREFSLVLVSDGILDTLPHPDLTQKRQFLVFSLEQTGFDTDAFADRLERQQGSDSSLPDDITLLLIRKRERQK